MSGLKISLLGGMEIGPAGGAGEISITRKAGAMIAYLALQDGRVQTRDKLAALFWSRNTDAQARTNLRQALSRLRKALANGTDGPLIVDADRIGLDTAGLELDVARFEQLVAEGSADSLEAATALYRGDLLDGVSLGEEGFDSWLRGERERLRILATGALGKLASHYESARDIERCIETAARLLALDPMQEAAHRALMRAYAAQRRYALALRQYRTCGEILERELSVKPDGETQALYRAIQEQRGAAKISEEHAGVLRNVEATAETLQGKGSTSLVLPDRPSVAVLPFANRSGDADQDYFADGVTENVITGLTRFRELFVIAPKTALLAHGLVGDPREAGAQLGVAHVVEGSVRRAGDRVRVTVQLADAADGRSVWAEHYDRDLTDVFAVQDEISGRIVATLVGRIEDATRRQAERKAPGDITAFDYLLRARSKLNTYMKEGILESRRLLEEALKTDPTFAAAWAELARSYLAEYESDWTDDRGAALDRARVLAEKAVALDGSDVVARYALANAHFYGKRHDLANAEIERAIELNPNDYHNLCSKAWFLAFAGRLDEGVACSREAMRLSPFAPDNCMLAIGYAEYAARRYEDAIEVLGRVSRRSAWRASYLAACYAQLGRMEQARAYAADVMESASSAPEIHDSGDPECWRRYWSNWFCYKDPADFEHFLEGMAKAGLPT